VVYHRHDHRDDFLIIEKHFFRAFAFNVIAANREFDLSLRFGGFTFGIGQLAYESRLVSSFSPSLGEIRTD
jgi:hypothetical protein